MHVYSLKTIDSTSENTHIYAIKMKQKLATLMFNHVLCPTTAHVFFGCSSVSMHTDNQEPHPVSRLLYHANSLQPWTLNHTWWLNYPTIYTLLCLEKVHNKYQMQTIKIQKITTGTDISFQEDFWIIWKTENWISKVFLVLGDI